MYYGQLGATHIVRNFYGVLRLVEQTDKLGASRRLVHGRIDHGRQYIGDDEQRRWPTLYFGHGSGIDLAMRLHPRRHAGEGEAPAEPGGGDKPHPLRVGIVGLGAGTIAAHGRKGDVLRYYEINPSVVTLCQLYFTFLEESPATVEIQLGDARLSLEQELAERGSQQFDVLAVDAFRNDAIPIHLLTEECADIYFRHLRPDGLLALHISNNVLDLTGVTRGLAQQLGKTAVRVIGGDDRARGARSGVWVIITSNQQFLDAVDEHVSDWTERDPPPLLWTDDFAALLQVLK
jgi:spermidine synthase